MVLRSLIHEILTNHLGYSKICAQWVHKQKRLSAAFSFPEGHNVSGDGIPGSIVDGDETWISHFTPEMKCQSIEWHHASSPSRPKQCKQRRLTRKLMASMLSHGVLQCEFMTRDETTNSESYCLAFKRLRRAIQNRR